MTQAADVSNSLSSGFAKGTRHGAVLAGIGFTVAAVACFAVSDTTAKYVTGFVPLMVALWFRYAIQAFITTVLIVPKYGVAALKTAHPKFQVLRGVLLAKVMRSGLSESSTNEAAALGIPRNLLIRCGR